MIGLKWNLFIESIRNHEQDCGIIERLYDYDDVKDELKSELNMR